MTEADRQRVAQEVSALDYRRRERIADALIKYAEELLGSKLSEDQREHVWNAIEFA